MMKTKYYEGLSKQQFEALTSIAFGGDGGYFHPKTLESLEGRGLIEGYKKTIYGKGSSVIDRLPLIVKAYYMPIPEHFKFCEWCSNHPELDQEI